MLMNNIRRLQNISLYLLSISILLLILIETILSLTPPIARDALIHHLAIPKLWLINGGFYEIKWSSFSYYPMNIDLFYLIPLYFSNDIIPNFIHMCFGIATSYFLYNYISNKFSRNIGLLGVLIFLSTPIIVRMSTVAYVDLGLVFFTTASLLAFIKWRDNHYKGYNWFILSAITMGLALGTKYNALIAWFFMSLAVTFSYSKDTGKQWVAVKYGISFFIISLIIFSPWLIKNIILTGNPLYPLFKGFFNNSNNLNYGDNTISLVPGSSYQGIFKMREMLYGENFWQTLLIPFRFFFQGQDSSDRYFDGVLNPILLIMVPFAFINKKFSFDKFLLLSFSFFFILMTFLLDQMRIRYFLPAIPPLVILTILGIINLWQWLSKKSNPWKNIFLSGTLCFILLMIGKNVIYISHYFQSTQPLSYILGKESKDEFISRHISSYAAITYINKNTVEKARVRLILLSGRGYYLNRSYVDDSSYGMDVIDKLVKNSKNDKLFQAYLYSLDCTHILVRMDLFHQFLQNNYSADDINQLFQQMKKTMNTVYNSNGYSVIEIK